jgi:hypothetical protein
MASNGGEVMQSMATTHLVIHDCHSVGKSGTVRHTAKTLAQSFEPGRRVGVGGSHPGLLASPLAHLRAVPGEHGEVDGWVDGWTETR